MKSPTIKTVVIAVIFAAIAYSVTLIDPPVSSNILVVLVFISAFITPLVTGNHSTSDSSSEDDFDGTNEDVKTLYVGNLPYRANETSVRELFSEYGAVHSVRLMKDKHTGKRRGFGFVEMTAADLDSAINALNDTEFQQRTLKVREAKERPERTEDNNHD